MEARASVLLFEEDVDEFRDVGDAFGKEHCKKFGIILFVPNKIRHFAVEMLFTESKNRSEMLFAESTTRE